MAGDSSAPIQDVSGTRLALRRLPPSVVSAANMFVGLLSCVLSMSGRPEMAAWCIIYCGFLDKLDGILARLLNVSSPFGMEMDSFSDFTSFGVAPAVLVWAIGSDLEPLPHWWIAMGAFSFPLLAAVRLARFNLETHADEECFVGVPTTFAAMLLAAIYLSIEDLGISGAGIPFVVALSPGFAALMVTDLRIPKLKPRKNRAFNCFQLLVAAAVLLVSVLRVLPEFPLAVGIMYLVVGARVGRRLRPTTCR